MTRADALRLARKKWGDGAQASDMRMTGNAIVWDAIDVLTGGDPRYGEGATWQEACRRAGLIRPNETVEEALS